MVALKTLNNMQVSLLEETKTRRKLSLKLLQYLWFDYMKKADNSNNIVSKRLRNDKRKFDFSKPLKVWVKDKQTDHITTFTDKKYLLG